MKKDPRAELLQVTDALRLLYVNWLALRENIELMSRNLICRLGNTFAPGADAYSVTNSRGNMTVFAREQGAELAGALAMAQVIERSNEFKEASAILAPLLAAVAEVEAEEQKERETELRAKQEFDQAREAAQKRALQAAESDSAVLAAKQKLKGAK